jgi:hypothetical protein
VIFNNLNSEKKKELLELSRPFHEQVLYEALIRLGIDPLTFDPDSFDENDSSFPPNLGEVIENAAKAINSLKIIERELGSIEDEV